MPLGMGIIGLMSVAPISQIPRRNPYRDPAAKPEWAQLTRLGGDRVAILFEDLRARISGIDGLVEELHFYGEEAGWLPRYRVGDRVLLTVEILPGNLTAAAELEVSLAKKILNSPTRTSRIKTWLRPFAIREGIALLRVRLSSRAHTCSLARLILQIQKGRV
ncbi:MAG TPA: hypothetical protein VG028_03025 [Terriglobia bacterium]|nr:hypothetical protein [Terriglobia bacterium]